MLTIGRCSRGCKTPRTIFTPLTLTEALLVAGGTALELYGARGHDLYSFSFLGEQGRNALLSSLAIPSFDYYETDAEVAAASFYSFNKAHAFRDGNKRFSVVGTWYLLARNQMFLIMSELDWERVAIDVASGAMPRLELTKMFEKRLVSTADDMTAKEGLYSQEDLAGTMAHLLDLTGALNSLSQKVTDAMAR